jgi:hypothetical protein
MIGIIKKKDVIRNVKKMENEDKNYVMLKWEK